MRRFTSLGGSRLFVDTSAKRHNETNPHHDKEINTMRESGTRRIEGMSIRQVTATLPVCQFVFCPRALPAIGHMPESVS